MTRKLKLRPKSQEYQATASLLRILNTHLSNIRKLEEQLATGYDLKLDNQVEHERDKAAMYENMLIARAEKLSADIQHLHIDSPEYLIELHQIQAVLGDKAVFRRVF